MDLKITPDFEIILSEGNHPLGIAHFQVYHAGVDLLANNPAVDSQISPSGFGSRIQMDEDSALFINIQVDASSANWVKLESTLKNVGKTDLDLDGLKLPWFELDANTFSPQDHIWSLQGAAVNWGQDFAFEIPIPYQRDNYLGHLQDAEGGGIPVNYFWKKGLGVGIMHIQPVPQEWYMPVTADARTIQTGLERRAPVHLHPGETFTAPVVVISVHHGDFFEPLDLYRALMEAQNIHPAEPTLACYEPAWCSWGYGFDINAKQMLGVLPVLKEMNIHWMTLDDRWFDAYGDWNPRAETFPGGEEEIRRMNDHLHQAGFKNQIWWYPLCAEDGHGSWDSHIYIVSDVLRQHPDWVVLHEDGTVARNNRHLAMLCPALPEVQEYTRDLTLRFIRDWGFDGHKLDNIYTMPACHNPAHHHRSPSESIEAFAKVYQNIFDITIQLKPDSVTQICPCGTPLLHSLVSTTNQTVTADPTSSLQIRQRIKFYKALMGSKAAVFADHVELSDGACDFASEIGTGGVPATKFIYPEDESLKPKLEEYWNLPPEKQAIWNKWFELYNKIRLSEGEYINLYDLAFDIPEGHAIRKAKDIYYAFFAPKYKGEIDLRGLENRNYRVVDYVTGKEIGIFSHEHSRLSADFKDFLLLQAKPVE